MSYDLSQAKDLSMGGQLIPAGVIVECKVTIEPVKRTANGNDLHNVVLEVISGQYIGSKFYDNIFISGGAKEWGLSKMKAILEFTHQAHVAGNQQHYKINAPTDLTGKKALAQVKIENYQDSEGVWKHKNTVKTYATPHSSSPTAPLYEAWAKGEQPFKTDEKPAFPTAMHMGAYGETGMDAPFQP